MDNEKKQISNLKNGIYGDKDSKKKNLYVLVTNQENETKKQTSSLGNVGCTIEASTNNAVEVLGYRRSIRK